MKTTFYATVVPQYGRYNWNRDKVEKIKVSKITQVKPKTMNGIVVKLTLEIPEQVFLPFAPEIVAVIPVDAVATPEVFIEVGDANG